MGKQATYGSLYKPDKQQYDWPKWLQFGRMVRKLIAPKKNDDAVQPELAKVENVVAETESVAAVQDIVTPVVPKVESKAVSNKKLIHVQLPQRTQQVREEPVPEAIIETAIESVSQVIPEAVSKTRKPFSLGWKKLDFKWPNFNRNGQQAEQKSFLNKFEITDKSATRLAIAALSFTAIGIASLIYMNAKQNKKIQPKALYTVNADSLLCAQEKRRNDSVFSVAKDDVNAVIAKYDSTYNEIVAYHDEELSVKDRPSKTSLDLASDSAHVLFKDDSVRLGKAYKYLTFGLNAQGEFSVKGQTSKGDQSLYESKLEYRQ